MGTISVANSLKDRAAKIDKEIDDYRAAIKTLEAERSEVVIALKALKRYGLVREPVVHSAKAELSICSNGKKKSAPKIIIEVIDRDFPDGVTSKVLLQRLIEAYDPNADPRNVRPALWTMTAAGRLEKPGETYRLPKNNNSDDF